MGKILVTYYTKTGSTKEVAEYIGKTFSDNGLETEVLSFPDVKSLNSYDGIVIGAPINGFRWVPQADEFTQQFKQELNGKPVAAYCLSYLSHHARPFFRKQIEKNFSKSATVSNPFEKAVFGGISASPMPKFFSFLFGLPETMPADTRDWAEIEKWTQSLLQTFTSK